MSERVWIQRLGTGMGKECRRYFYEKQGGLCYWCQKECLDVKIGGHFSDTFTVDHIVPRRRGGDGKESNLVGACHECNQRRNEIELKLEAVAKFYVYFKKQPLHFFPVSDPSEIVKSSE